MRLLSGKRGSLTPPKCSIGFVQTGFVQTISVTVLLVLTSCASRTDNASVPNQTTENRSQAQSSSVETPRSPTAPGANGSTSGTTVNPGSTNPGSTNLLDNDLIIQGAQDNLFELQVGQLALQRATNAEVKQFAQEMVQDHTRATGAIQQLATERNLTLPTTMGNQNQAVFDRLSGLSGAEFDQAYMTEMVNSHQKGLAFVRNQAQNGKDQELKALAAEHVGALEAHLNMAQALAQRLNS